ncbi:MAG TPA: hypothetical protein PKZ12_07980 [Smithellaceae bacterium]|nr:hypothetical protein [Smithellaceae bacterium]
MRKIALKYCGGCNPRYDRVRYYQRILDALQEEVQWVSVEDDDYELVLLIKGCEASCLETKITKTSAVPVLIIREDCREPAEIAEMLLAVKRGDDY